MCYKRLNQLMPKFILEKQNHQTNKRFQNLGHNSIIWMVIWKFVAIFGIFEWYFKICGHIYTFKKYLNICTHIYIFIIFVSVFVLMLAPRNWWSLISHFSFIRNFIPDARLFRKFLNRKKMYIFAEVSSLHEKQLFLTKSISFLIIRHCLFQK